MYWFCHTDVFKYHNQDGDIRSKGNYNVPVCAGYTCTHTHSCTVHQALNASLICPRVYLLLCVTWSRAKTTKSGASESKFTHPQHTHLTTVQSFSPIFTEKREKLHNKCQNIKRVTFSHDHEMHSKPIYPLKCKNPSLYFPGRLSRA